MTMQIDQAHAPAATGRCNRKGRVGILARFRLFVPWILLGLYSVNTGPAMAHDNPGGPVLAYAAEVDRLNRLHQPVFIDGVCASACTMYLGVEGMCVTHDAFFKFHAASEPGSDRPDAFGSLVMMAHYPKAIRDWAIRSGALESVEFSPAHSLTGDEAHRMGVPYCP